MPQPYRSKEQIIQRILQIVQKENVSKTRIMYLAYLSYSQLKKYLGLLESNGLIKEDKNNMSFSITVKGIKLLELSDEMNKLY